MGGEAKQDAHPEGVGLARQTDTEDVSDACLLPVVGEQLCLSSSRDCHDHAVDVVVGGDAEASGGAVHVGSPLEIGRHIEGKQGAAHDEPTNIPSLVIVPTAGQKLHQDWLRVTDPLVFGGHVGQRRSALAQGIDPHGGVSERGRHRR